MDDFINVFKKGPQIRITKNIMLDRYFRKPYKYQSKIGNDSLIQNVILKELIKKSGYYNNRFRYRIKNEN